jgi:hypothetical protein
MNRMELERLWRISQADLKQTSNAEIDNELDSIIDFVREKGCHDLVEMYGFQGFVDGYEAAKREAAEAAFNAVLKEHVPDKGYRVRK